MSRFWKGIGAVIALASVAVWVMFARANVERLPMDDQARAAAPGEFATLSDGVTHYELAGPQDGAPVVLVHGFSVPSYIWDTTFVALTEAGFRVLRYDTLGRGYSDRPDVDYNGDLFERQLLELIDAVGMDGPVDLVGLSMGGGIVARAAANNPERVRRLVLVDPMHAGRPAPGMPEFIGGIYLGINLMPHMAEGQLTDFLYPENYPDWVDKYRVQMQYEGFRRAIVSTIYHFVPEDHLAHYARIDGHGIPAKLIWGVEDQTLDIAGARNIQEVLAVDFMPVDDAGHLPHIEQAETVNLAIANFLGDATGTVANGGDMEITADSFRCLEEMTKVRHFYVDNLLGNVEATIATAESTDGGVYPPGSVVQLVPTEVMIKHAPGWNPATRDWEFFELDVSEEGSSIRNRGFVDVVNKFGGNCFGCHLKAEEKYDMICEQDHGCDPIPVTREMIAGIQAADPRCVN